MPQRDPARAVDQQGVGERADATKQLASVVPVLLRHERPNGLPPVIVDRYPENREARCLYAL